MKTFFNKRALPFVLGLLLGADVALARDVKICLTGSTERIIPAYGEAFENGAKLALTGLVEPGYTFTIEPLFYDPTPLAPAKTIREAYEKGCAMVVGFSTMNDLLVVRNFAREHNIVVLSIYGEKDARFNDSPNVMTLQPPADFLVSQSSKFIESVIPPTTRAALVVTAVDQEAFTDYKKEFIKLLRRKNIPFDTLDFLERPFDLAKVQAGLKENISQYDVVFLLARSVQAGTISDLVYEMRKQRNRPPSIIIGTKYFGSPQFPGFLQKIKHQDIAAYFPHNGCLCDPTPAYQQYLASYRAKYGKEPGLISAGAYDAVKFAATAVHFLPKGGKGPVGPKDFLEAAKKAQIEGLSGISISPGLKVKYNRYFVYKVQPGGYSAVAPERLAE